MRQVEKTYLSCNRKTKPAENGGRIQGRKEKKMANTAVKNEKARHLFDAETEARLNAILQSSEKFNALAKKALTDKDADDLFCEVAAQACWIESMKCRKKLSLNVHPTDPEDVCDECCVAFQQAHDQICRAANPQAYLRTVIHHASAKLSKEDSTLFGSLASGGSTSRQRIQDAIAGKEVKVSGAKNQYVYSTILANEKKPAYLDEVVMDANEQPYTKCDLIEDPDAWKSIGDVEAKCAVDTIAARMQDPLMRLVALYYISLDDTCKTQKTRRDKTCAYFAAEYGIDNDTCQEVIRNSMRVLTYYAERAYTENGKLV